MYKLSVKIFLLLICLAPLMKISAQEVSIDTLDIVGLTDYTLTPAVPGPNQKVQVTITGSGFDMDSANFVWSVNGQKIQSGQGIKSVTITTGPIGSKSIVRTVITSGKNVYYKSVVIIPGSVDLLWQGDTYTPPFYEGRSLWSNQSKLSAVAIPHIKDTKGNTLNPKNLIYKWYVDGSLVDGLSGAGKNYFWFIDSILSLSREIRVDVFIDSETIAGTASIYVSPIRPKLLVYENNPLYGFMFNREVGDTFPLNKEEVSYASFPLNFSVFDRLSNAMNYVWTTNPSGDVRNTDVVTYRINQNDSGQSAVHAEAKNVRTLIQSASRDFLVQFGNEKTI